MAGGPLLPQRGALSPPGVPELSQNHAACCSCHRASGGKRHTGHVRIQNWELEGGRVGKRILWREEEAYQGVSKMPELIFWCIKRYCTSSDHTTNTTVWVLRLLCAVQHAHCWRSCPGLRRRDHRRSGCRESRCGWCTVTQSDSSWCREPQPRYGRRRCMQTGSPRAEQQGYRR